MLPFFSQSPLRTCGRPAAVVALVFACYIILRQLPAGTHSSSRGPRTYDDGNSAFATQMQTVRQEQQCCNRDGNVCYTPDELAKVSTRCLKDGANFGFQTKVYE